MAQSLAEFIRMTREEFTQLASKEQAALRRFLMAACGGNREVADDVAQEALLKAYVAKDRFQPEAGFSAWLRRIAFNCLGDYQRKERLRDSTYDLDKAHGVAGEGQSDQAFEYQELHAIEELTLSERTAILLFYLEDRPVREVSTARQQVTSMLSLSHMPRKCSKH